ncbi:MAG: hypothetical protein ACRDXE_07950, partial [Acidimicrobiales bacterium]
MSGASKPPGRVLFSCFPGCGHLHPLIPLAAAYRDAGWDVAVASGPELCPHVSRHGFPAFPIGLSAAETQRRYLDRHPGADRLPPAQRLAMVAPGMFVEVAAACRARDLVALVERWQPDLIVHDLAEFAAPLAGALAGVKHVTHGFGILNPDPQLLA